MALGGDAGEPTPERRPDFEIIDAEPWLAPGPVDELIVLQSQAFDADRGGNPNLFGHIVMKMSAIESSIGNHTEAAAYASEAAEAFETGRNPEAAIAARSTQAGEYRVLYSPELALASLSEIVALKAGLRDRPKWAQILGGSLAPVFHLLENFTATFSRTEIGCAQDEIRYPSVNLSKYPKPSRDAGEDFFNSLEPLLALPVSLRFEEVSRTLSSLSLIYGHMASRRFGMSGSERFQARMRAETIGMLSLRGGAAPATRAARILSGREGHSLNDIFRDYTLSDLRFL